MEQAATKTIKQISISKKDPKLNVIQKEAANAFVERKLSSLYNELNKLSQKNGYLADVEKKLIFIPSMNAILPHPDNFEYYIQPLLKEYNTPKSRFLTFDGISGRMMYEEEADQIIDILHDVIETARAKSPEITHMLCKNNKISYMNINTHATIYPSDIQKDISNSTTNAMNAVSAMIALSSLHALSSLQKQSLGNTLSSSQKQSSGNALLYPIYSSLTLDIFTAVSAYGFVPESLNQEYRNMLAGIIKCTKENEQPSYIELVNRYREVMEKVLTNTPVNEFIISPEKISELYLNSDYIRCDLEPYDEKLLTDINRGHWELWNNSVKNGVIAQLKTPITARNPASDVRSNGVIAIDFGTKSTIVVCKDGSKKAFPMRVRIGKLRKQVNSKHYENPTVMEFIDLNSFLRDYSAENGRPHTKWEDLTISHTAQNQLINGSSSDYCAFFSELKQWCADKEHSVKLKDKKGRESLLKPYIYGENSFDPIEIYAYYLGLYINNMYNGIYLEYMLSFPVTFDKELKDKLKASFERGIKKSLPDEILSDPELMKLFHIDMGISEPAAYAVCALKQYGFDPDEGENFYFGVFDFGGGTTDFDFGIWSGADDSNMRYDYVIEHFGAGGDRYLGGENLLLEMAYSVLKDNLTVCAEKSFHFRRPPECDRFTGDEIIVNSSQEAAANLRQTAEALRPLWEKTDGDEEIRKNQCIKVDLFSEDGSKKPGETLKVNTDKLDEYLKKRIQQGVSNFFESLKLVFKLDKMQTADKINILLAGNSCLSPLVREAFDEYIGKDTRKKRGADSWYELFPPLGSAESKAKLKEMGLEISDDIAAPTGKTGVAFGLADCRKGGTIKVISKNETESGETKFRYFVGRIRKGTLRTVISSGSEYGVWQKYLPADEETFCVNYTTLPEASTQKLPEEKTEVLRLHLDELFPDKFIFLRAVSPDEIEYAAGTEDNGTLELLTKPVKAKLK